MNQKEWNRLVCSYFKKIPKRILAGLLIRATVYYMAAVILLTTVVYLLEF